MNEIKKQFKNFVILFLANKNEIEEKEIDDAIEQVRTMPLFNSISEEEIEKIKAEVKSEFSIKLDKGVLIEEEHHERWFLAKKASLEMKYWERYRTYLLNDKGFSPKVVNTMDDVLDTLTDLLGNPTRNISYKRRGLIIGDVQSGKTANYTGLICKGVDAGYKVVVLLTGTIERLRQQTQQRIDEGFVGRDSDAMMKQQDEGVIIGVGKYDPSVCPPMVLTSTTDDFKQQNARNLIFDLKTINGSIIFVVKKNSAVLKRLNKWFKTFNQNGKDPIDNSILVIDDEADNASVNTKAEDSPTAINGHIREMLKMFTKSSYVGFTATPFANIFIDPDSYDEMVAEDLFPKDYIYSLNAPSNYIGARNIFEENADASYMLNIINDDETDKNSIAFILPLKHKSTIQVSHLSNDLKEAVETFMLANTIEDIRGMSNNHRSMLVNVSRFTAVQEQVSDLVNEYLKDLQSACRLYSNMEPQKALKDERISKLKETYEKIYKDKIGIEWDKIQNNLHSSCAPIIVQTINQRNGKKLSYDEYKDGLRLIAVGGMSLSRGLTLEGLVVSYFYRNSKMYDTLMQMGRWFGYRKGYDDLCRIWMSDESIEWYRHISQATDELREEIKRYEDTGLTPMDFGLRVRSDINSLIVTARNKMRSAESRRCLISLSGEYIETPEIYSSIEKNKNNFMAVKALVSDLLKEKYNIEKLQRRDSIKYGFKNIPLIKIIDTLEKLDISPKNEQFNISSIKKFITKYRGNELKKWDILFASGNSELLVELEPGIKYNAVERSYSVENNGKILKMSGSKRRLGTASDGKYGLSEDEIKKVKQKLGTKNPSQKSYFVNTERNPLLIVYCIGLKQRNENISEEEKKIQELTKNQIMIGFGLGIPTLSDNATKYAQYMLNKIAINTIFDNDIDNWDDEELED